ncbi:hypothetical protein EDF61_103379 [Arthrobacter sp. JUb115]|nr:hypothetical protein EDF61_103379 [Arthrobacter sp. JUb115]
MSALRATSAMNSDDQNTIGALLRRSVARCPADNALAFGERNWTYSQLADGVNRVTARLRQACRPVRELLPMQRPATPMPSCSSPAPVPGWSTCR